VKIVAEGRTVTWHTWTTNQRILVKHKPSRLRTFWKWFWGSRRQSGFLHYLTGRK